MKTRFRASREKSTRRNLRTKFKSTLTCLLCCGSFNRSHRKVGNCNANNNIQKKISSSKPNSRCVRKREKKSDTQIRRTTQTRHINRTKRVISPDHETVELRNRNQITPKSESYDGENKTLRVEQPEERIVVRAIHHPSCHSIHCEMRHFGRHAPWCDSKVFCQYNQSSVNGGVENSSETATSKTETADTGSELNNLIISDTKQLDLRIPSFAEVRSMREKMVRRKVDPKIHPQIYQMTRKTNSPFLDELNGNGSGQCGGATRNAGVTSNKNERQCWSLNNRGSLISNRESSDGHAFRTASQMLKSKKEDEMRWTAESKDDKSFNLLIPVEALPISFYFPKGIRNDSVKLVRVLTPSPIRMENDTRW